MLDIRELDLQACGTVAAVAEADLAERFGRQGPKLLSAGARVPRGGSRCGCCASRSEDLVETVRARCADEVVHAAAVAQRVDCVVDDFCRSEDFEVAENVVQGGGGVGRSEEETSVNGVGADGVAVGVGAGHAVFGVDGDQIGAAGGYQVRELP
ncbi:hypothetical protein GCM10010348_76540 [Streptomyces anthocyanicus]|uniref:hypothetical protein n=1 Tax=Streptomyces sp. WG5 TaxID=3417648 RepID=UPI0019BF2F40|nr:hypothetical protein GCM10010348_76540 [Streptomyces anthocyanicus]